MDSSTTKIPSEFIECPWYNCVQLFKRTSTFKERDDHLTFHLATYAPMQRRDIPAWRAIELGAGSLDGELPLVF